MRSIEQILKERERRETSIAGTILPERVFARGNDQYGALFAASKYCSLPDDREPMIVGCEWQHGWHPPEHNLHPELVTGTSGSTMRRRKACRFLVAREDQVKYLGENKYWFVHAVGMPIIYVDAPHVPRDPGSLLVMPVHTTDDIASGFNSERYASEIERISHKFTRVVVCVHSSCLKHGNWIDAFEKRNIPVISGAYLKDKNSLLRMATLFSRFEFVTSNGFGSQMAYSALFGAKPSVFGNIASISREAYSRASICRACPELVDYLIEVSDETYLRKHYPEIFVSPWDASNLQEWAEWQLGRQCKRSPNELKSLLGWTTTGRAKTSMIQTARAIRKLAIRKKGSS